MALTIQALRIELQADASKLRTEIRTAAEKTSRDISKLEKRIGATEAKFKQLTGATQRSAGAMRQASAAMNKTRGSAIKLGTAIALVYSAKTFARMGADILNAADSVKLLEARFNAVTTSKRGIQDVYEVAQDLGAGLVDTGALFTKIAIGTSALGASAEDIREISRAILQLGRVSGLTFAEVNYFSRQIAQGIASGTLQGDELRSIRENMPVVAQQLARAFTELQIFGKGVVVTAGDLKGLGKEGKLTSEILYKGFRYIVDSGIAQEMFDTLPETFEQSMNRIRNEWVLLLDVLATEFGKAAFYDEIRGIADIFKEIRIALIEQGWDSVGATLADQVLLGFLGAVRSGWAGAGGDVSRFILSSPLLKAFGIDIKEEALDKIDELMDAAKKRIEQRAGTIQTDVNWEQFVNVDKLDAAGEKLVARIAEVQRQIEEAKFAAAPGQPVAFGEETRIRVLQEILDQLLIEYGEWQQKHKLLVSEIDRESTIVEKTTKTLEDYRREWAQMEKGLPGLTHLPGLFGDDGGTKSAGTGKAGSDAIEAAIKQTDRYKAGIEALAAGGEEALKRLEAEWRVQDRLTDLAAQGKTNDYLEYIEPLIRVEEQARESFEAAKEPIGELNQFAVQAARSMQSAFADYLFDPFDDGLKGMLQGFVDIIRRMIAEMIAFQVLSGIPFLKPFITGTRAMGGPVSQGSAYLVGERGPELFVPHTSGNVIPNSSLGAASAAGMGEQINIVQNIDARGNQNPSELLALMPRLADAIKRDIRDERRRGL